MARKNKGLRKSTSCGGVPWRVKEGRLEILLIKQFAHKDRWGIPKGHMHPGETVEQCALREIREEAGVVVVLGVRLPDASTVYKNEDKTVVSWLARPVGDDEPRHDDPDSEVADARWFGVDVLPEIHVYQRPLIATAVETLFKVIDGIERRYQPMQPPEPRLLTKDDD
jgi:8-oxo-dGTP pyrophosphatase MutT (NUDIX family)